MQVSSLSTVSWFSRILFLLCVISCEQVGRFCQNRCCVANGFELSSRHHHHNRHHLPNRRSPNTSRNAHRHDANAISDSSKAQSVSNSCSSGCKYDLGLGKNAPFQTNGRGLSRNRQTGGKQEQPDPVTVTANDNTNTNTGTTVDAYEACRFLVEHKSTREYPAPIRSNSRDNSVARNSKDKILANPSATTVTSTSTSTSTLTSTSTKVIFAASPSNGKQTRNSLQEMRSANDKLPIIKTKATATADVTARNRKRQHLAKVQPKRLLEDCLTILDHHHHHELADADSGASSASAVLVTSTSTSTIWSRPDTPQLDMNSVWVEMLLHNQMSRLKP